MSNLHEPPTWDGESYCVRDNCFEPALYEKPWGMSGSTPVVELVCGFHMNSDD